MNNVVEKIFGVKTELPFPLWYEKYFKTKRKQELDAFLEDSGIDILFDLLLECDEYPDLGDNSATKAIKSILKQKLK
jgi:hypothetical protein